MRLFFRSVKVFSLCSLFGLSLALLCFGVSYLFWSLHGVFAVFFRLFGWCVWCSAGAFWSFVVLFGAFVSILLFSSNFMLDVLVFFWPLALPHTFFGSRVALFFFSIYPLSTF